jgi:hypothetical protein
MPMACWLPSPLNVGEPQRANVQGRRAGDEGQRCEDCSANAMQIQRVNFRVIRGY